MRTGPFLGPLGRYDFAEVRKGRDERGYVEAPAPFQRILQAHESDNAILWNRIEVALPTLAFPSASAVFVGSAPGGLNIHYSAKAPSREYPALGASFEGAWPAGIGGACYLWQPGVWWIRQVRTGAGATGTLQVPWAFFPGMSDAEAFRFASIASPHRAFTTSPNVPVLGTVLLTLNQMLAGTVAVSVQATTQAIRTRWEEPPGGGGQYEEQAAGERRVWEGALLPLAQLSATSPGAAADVRLVRYER